MSQTGENEQSLRAIIDLMRKCSIVLLILHFYVSFYQVFEYWHLTAPIGRKILMNLGRTGLFSRPINTKLIVAGLLVLSLIGPKGKKDEKINPGSIAAFILVGLVLYFCSVLLIYLNIPVEQLTIAYISIYLYWISAGVNGGSEALQVNKTQDEQGPVQ